LVQLFSFREAGKLHFVRLENSPSAEESPDPAASGSGPKGARVVDDRQGTQARRNSNSISKSIRVEKAET
jgi:hypothetical protein